MPSWQHKAIGIAARLGRCPAWMARDMAANRDRAKGPPPALAPRFDRFEHEGRPVYRVRPSAGPPKGRMVHLHGGGFVYGILRPHFEAMATLADLSGREIWLPEYPLPPSGDAVTINAWTDSFIDGLMAEGPLLVSGDSAGGGLALGAASRRVLADRSLPQHILLLSPWVDLTMTNPALDAADKTEFILGLKEARLAAARYAGDLDLDDPLVSPINGLLAGLPDVTIHAGAKDLLFPDIKRLRSALNEAAVGGGIVIEQELGHYWMFMPQPEAAKTWKRIGAAIRDDEGRFPKEPPSTAFEPNEAKRA